jgi:hypothetical protein
MADRVFTQRTGTSSAGTRWKGNEPGVADLLCVLAVVLGPLTSYAQTCGAVMIQPHAGRSPVSADLAERDLWTGCVGLRMTINGHRWLVDGCDSCQVIAVHTNAPRIWLGRLCCHC